MPVNISYVTAIRARRKRTPVYESFLRSDWTLGAQDRLNSSRASSAVMALMYRAVLAPDHQPVTDRPSVSDPNAFDNKLAVAGGAIRRSAINKHRFNRVFAIRAGEVVLLRRVVVDAPLLHDETFAAVAGAQRFTESRHTDAVEDISIETTPLASDPHDFSHVREYCVSASPCACHIDRACWNSSRASSADSARVHQATIAPDGYLTSAG